MDCSVERDVSRHLKAQARGDAQDEAIEQIAAEVLTEWQGDGTALTTLGEMIAEGDALATDPMEALLAADANDAEVLQAAKQLRYNLQWELGIRATIEAARRLAVQRRRDAEDAAELLWSERHD